MYAYSCVFTLEHKCTQIQTNTVIKYKILTISDQSLLSIYSLPYYVM